MFYSIKGDVILASAGTVVVEAGGVGYLLNVSGRTLGYAAEKKKDGAVRFFTYMSVREDAVELFGFSTESELALFRQLIGVSGVGPKAAISILTQLSPDEVVSAILSGDAKTITRAPGIGKKIAERIILELKDRIAKEFSDGPLPEDVPGLALASENSEKYADAESTLMVLGYTKSEIGAALRGIDVGALSVENVIREALKRLTK